MPDFIPRTESQLIPWFQNFATKLATHGPTVGVTAGEITQAADDSTMVQRVVNGRQVKFTDSLEWTSFKDLVLHSPANTPLPAEPTTGTITPAAPAGAEAAIIARTRALAARIKAHPSYVEAMGKDLGIVVSADLTPPSAPALECVPESDFAVRIKFSMGGFPMLEIQSKRGAETVFTPLAFDTNSPYVDSRAPLTPNTPEVRTYRARFREDDQPVGDWSQEASVTARV